MRARICILVLFSLISTSCLSSQEKALDPGWNLISFPVEQGTGTDAVKVYEADALKEPNQPPLGYWGSRYVGLPATSASVLTPSEGHWVWAGGENWSLGVEGSTNRANPTRIPLSPGWNLIGNPFERLLSREMVFQNWDSGATPSPFLGRWYVWENGDYHTTDALSPWQGAWVLADQETQLTAFSGYLFEPKGHTRSLLSWAASVDPKVVGYNIYKDGVKMNDGLVASTSYMVGHLVAGASHVFQIKAVDAQSQESDLTSPMISATLPVSQGSTGVIGGRVMKVKTPSQAWVSGSPILEPVADVSVVLSGSNRVEQTDAWGYFEFDGLSPGDFTLEIQDSALGMGQAKVKVEVGRSVDAGPIVFKIPIELDVGAGFSCAIKERKLFCWGNNRNGQLGNGIRLNGSGIAIDDSGEIVEKLFEPKPLEVPGLNDVIAVKVSHDNTCALSMDGSLHCWGSNMSGVVGLGNNTGGYSVPILVPGIKNIISFDVGAFHACAINAEGTTFCWGKNFEGQLGVGNMEDQYAPFSHKNNNAIAIGTGNFHSCELNVDGRVSCWGDRTGGQIGDGKIVPSPQGVQLTPAIVPNLSGVDSLVTGLGHTCVMTQENIVKCWGDRTGVDPGTGTDPISSPHQILGLGAVKSIAAGSAHSCAVVSNGKAVCWGSNRFGELGSGEIEYFVNPGLRDVINIGRLEKISAGASSTCAISNNFDIFCWGSNDHGELGDGTSYELRAYPDLVKFK